MWQELIEGEEEKERKINTKYFVGKLIVPKRGSFWDT